MVPIERWACKAEPMRCGGPAGAPQPIGDDGTSPGHAQNRRMVLVKRTGRDVVLRHQHLAQSISHAYAWRETEVAPRSTQIQGTEAPSTTAVPHRSRTWIQLANHALVVAKAQIILFRASNVVNVMPWRYRVDRNQRRVHRVADIRQLRTFVSIALRNLDVLAKPRPLDVLANTRHARTQRTAWTKTPQ